MKLSDYLAEEKLTEQAFARLVGVSHTTVGRWIDGMEPRSAMVSRIVGATGGKVTATDLAPKTAAIFSLTDRSEAA